MTASHSSDDAKRLLAITQQGGEKSYFWSSATKKSNWHNSAKIIDAPLPTLENLYFGVHPAQAGAYSANERSKIATICALNCFYAEFDVKDFGTWDDLDTHIKNLPVAPSVQVTSGGGVHCYWFFNKTVKIDDTNRPQWAGLQAQWVAKVGGDGAAKDLARVLRVPDTWNVKYTPKRSVFVRSGDWCEYDVNHLIDAMQTHDDLGYLSSYDDISEIVPPAQQPMTGGIDAGARALIDGAIAKMQSAIADTNRNQSLNDACCIIGGLVGANRITRDEGLRIAEQLKQIATGKGLPVGEVEKTSKSGFEAGIGKPLHSRPMTTSATTPTTQRKKIVITNKQLPDIANECIAELLKLKTIYTRNGQLVIIKIDETNSPIISILNVDALKAQMAQAAEFVEIRGKKETAVYPPTEAAKYILHSHNNIFPALLGIIESPLMRLDGTILDSAGYDPQTTRFYHPQRDLNMLMLENPTQETAQVSYELLCDIVQDIPFASDADRDNFIASTITQFVDEFIDIKPICAFTAPQQSTGKTLCANVGVAIATGRLPALGAAPTTPEEWQKRLTTNIVAGKNVIFFDNLTDTLENAALAGLVTSGIWEDRLLGGNTLVSMPNRAQIIVTGNNLRFGGDMITRVMAIRLDAKMARPQERETFKYPDIVNHVLENRGLFVTAILTMCQAWYEAGRPKPGLAPKCRFIKWRDVVGGILEYAGAKSFLANMREVYASADDDGPQWESFIMKMNSVFAKSAVTSSMIFSRCIDSDELTAAVPEQLLEHLNDKGKGKFAQRLGYELKSRKDKRFGDSGAYVTSAPTSTTSPVKMWIFNA